MVMSESVPEEENQRPDEGNLQAPSPLVHGRISSDESEAEGNEEPPEIPSSAAHPRPVAVRGSAWGLAMGKENLKIPARTIFCFSTKKILGLTCNLSHYDLQMSHFP